MRNMIFFLALAACLSLGAARGESSPPLYRVEDGQGHTLYLLGTIHMGKEEMYPLGDAFEAAWRAADVLAVEADPDALRLDAQTAARYSAAMLLENGDSCRNHLSPETYRLGVERLGKAEAILDRMRPMAWNALAEANAFAAIGCAQEWGADMMLLRRARAEGKRVEELEGTEKQLEIMRSVPDEVQDAEIYRMLADPEGTQREMQTILDAWCAGDEETLNGYILPEAKPGEAYARYRENVYTARNERFEIKAVEALRSGETALFAVGTAHVIGEDGLAARLARAGFTVERLGR